jgi:lipopolysaccharide export LptBFGC system permease protein LptF
MLLIGILKVTAGFLVGANVGRYCSKNELSPILGVSLTVALTIAACVLLDKAFA